IAARLYKASRRGQIEELQRQLACEEEPKRGMVAKQPAASSLAVSVPAPSKRIVTAKSAHPLSKPADWVPAPISPPGWTPRSFENEQGGCDHKTSLRMLTGQKVKKSTLERIANAFGIDIDDIPSS